MQFIYIELEEDDAQDLMMFAMVSLRSVDWMDGFRV